MRAGVIRLYGEETVRDYERFLLSIEGLISRSLTRSDALSPRSRRAVATELHRIAQEAARATISVIRMQSRALAQTASLDVEASLNVTLGNDTRAAIRKYTSELTKMMTHDLTAQFHRDARSGEEYMRRLALAQSIYQTKNGYNMGAAFVAARKTTLSPKYQFRDRAGRVWKSSDYVRAHTMLHMRTVYNEAVLTSAASLDLKKVYVQSEPDSAFHNAVIDLDPLSPNSYEAMRMHYFHPYSDRVLSVVRT